MRHAKRVPWRRIGVLAAIAAPVLMIAVQLAYPHDRVQPYAKIAGIAIGGMSQDEAVKTVDAAYQSATLAIYFGEAKDPYRSPILKDLGVEVDSQQAVQANRYAWWLRLIPSSFWWAHLVSNYAEVSVHMNDQTVRDYVTAELGESCHVDPINASIKASRDKLTLVPSEDGGTCVFDDVVTQITGATPEPAGQATARLAVAYHPTTSQPRSTWQNDLFCEDILFQLIHQCERRQ